MKISKSAVSLLLALLMIIPASSFARAENGDFNSFILGDVDSDGRVTASDALHALKISAYIEQPTDSAVLAGDIDADGEITPPDARRILRIASRLDKPENTALPSVINKMTTEPFCIDEALGAQTVKDRLIAGGSAVSVKTDEKEASELTGGERVERRTVIINGADGADGEYVSDCVHEQYISYPDSVYGSSFGDYALYFGLLGSGYDYSVYGDASAFSLSYDDFGARYVFTFSGGKLIGISSEYDGETVSFAVSDVRFNECGAADLLIDYTDITSDYLNDYIASSLIDDIEIGYSAGDSEVYVTENLDLPEAFENYPSAEIVWLSDSGNITSGGVVTRDKNRVVKVRLTAELTVGSAVKQRTFTLDVMPENVKPADVNNIYTLSELNGGRDILTRDENGRVTVIDGVCSFLTVENFSDALAVLKQNAAILASDSDEIRFEPMSYEENDGGTQYTFKQFFGESEVYLRRVTVAAGKNGECSYIASGLCQNDTLGGCESFIVSESRAVNTAVNFYNGEIQATNVNNIIYALGEYENAPIPVWLVTVEGTDPDGYYISDDIYINAVNGKIIKNSLTYDSVMFSNGVGNDENGVNREFPTVRDSFYTYLMSDEERNIGVYDYSDGLLLSPIISFDNTFDDPTAVCAYMNTAAAYDWFKDKFSRISFDNRGSKINVAVHDTSYYDNAYWDSGTQILTFCENSPYTFGTVTSAAAPDIASHEYSHAVIESITGALPYENATGAINEAYADIFACLIDGNWTIGENRDTIRDIADPYKFENPIKLYGKYFIDYNNVEDDDFGGVHTNSTVVSHCAYLMSRYGLDGGTSARVWYMSLSLGYDGTSDFSTVRRNVTKAAELLNLSDGEKDIINNAFDNVNIY